MATLAGSTTADGPQLADAKGKHGGEGSGGGSSLERVTVNLTSRSVAALEALVALSGDTKTDAINKALQIYAYLQQHMDGGGKVYVREPGSDELERLRFL